MRRFTDFLPIFLFSLLLAACQNTDESSPETVKESEQEKPAINEEIAGLVPYSLDGEEIEKEPDGEFYARHAQEQELADDSEYEPAAEETVKDYVNEVEKLDTADWDEEKWARSIISSLRANPAPYIEPIRNLEVKFEDLKLPDGRLLQDVPEDELNEEGPAVAMAILIDASGSMKADVQGGNKMELAKASVKSFTKDLPDNVKVSLTVFGHEGTGNKADKALSCGSIEQLYPLETYDEQKFTTALNSFQASGWTPLAGAIEQAEKHLLEAAGEEETFMYVISDGIETCDGNPVEAAKQAKKNLDGLKINIIGFDVDDEADRQLKEVAEVGGGQYTAAQNKQQLDEVVSSTWKEQINQTTWLFWSVHNEVDINSTANKLSGTMDDTYADGVKARVRERDRLQAALQMIEDEDLIDSGLKSKIRPLLSERSEALKKHADEVRKEKHTEIFDTTDRLKKLVDQISAAAKQ